MCWRQLADEIGLGQKHRDIFPVSQQSMTRDWNLLVTGQDANGNYKVWSLIYGDGGDVPAGVWSSLKELASAPAGGDFEYGPVFLDKPDVYRAFYVEKFSGVQSYNRPFLDTFNSR